jgi:signal transduction histidine kinase
LIKKEGFLDMQEGLDTIANRSKGLVTFVNAYRDYTNIPEPKKQLVPASSLIDTVLQLMKEDLKARTIEVQKEIYPENLEIACDPDQITMILLNLLKNAAQAIHQRGDNDQPGQITLRVRLVAPWAEIQVEDNGIGMPESVRKRIFEPFFTTKEVGQGTGLGLSVSYFIITNNHKGQMEAHSTPGQGTCFTVRLPLSSPHSETGL